MGPRLPITTASRVFFAGAALLLLGACASTPVEPETGGPGQKVGSAQVLSICEKLAKSQDTRLAIGLCEKAHIEDQQNPVPLLLLGDMLQQQGALAQAGRAYGMAIDLDPENVEAHYGLGKVFLARNQFDLAIEQFEVARELNTRDHRLYNALGVVLDNLGDHIAAQAHYKIGLELAPNNHALQKNLMLSRRLDNSVTTPAIGPRHNVVPRSVAPQTSPDQPLPGAAPNKSAPASPGRLGHEPLAQVPVPVEVPVRDSFEAAAVITVPAPKALPSPKAEDKVAASDRQQTTTEIPADEVATRKVEAQKLSEQTAAVNPKTRLIPLPPRAKPPVPAYVAARAAPQDKVAQTSAQIAPAVIAQTAPKSAAPSVILQSAYDEIPLPAEPREAEPRLSRAAEAGPTILASGLTSVRVEAEALPVLKATLEGVQIALAAERPDAIPESVVDEVSVAAVETLAAGRTDNDDLVKNARARVEKADEAQSSLPSSEKWDVVESPSSAATDRVVSNSGGNRFESETFSWRETAQADLASSEGSHEVSAPAVAAGASDPVVEPASAGSSGTGLALDSAKNPAAISTPLSLVSNDFLQTASLESGDAGVELTARNDEFAAVTTARRGSELRTSKPRRRFGREHEEDHETRHVEGEIWDLVDVVNPMQHIPVVATIYRDVTDDEIKPAAKIAGGTLFGGVLGFASSLVDSMIEETVGQDIGETALAAISEPADAPSDDPALAHNWRREELHLAQARGR